MKRLWKLPSGGNNLYRLRTPLIVATVICLLLAIAIPAIKSYVDNRIANLSDRMAASEGANRSYVDSLDTGRAATLVVAAANSSELSKQQADYVCDGIEHSLLIEDCEDAWNEFVATDVTSTADTTDKKVGSASAKLVVEDSVSAGTILATEAITPTDLSDHRAIRLWIKSSTALADGDLQLLLDNTANCSSPVDSIDLFGISADTWTQIVVPQANPAGGIISVGLKMVNDRGAFEVKLDDINQVWGGDGVEIQQAMDALPSSGGKIVLSDGTFYAYDMKPPQDKDVILRGQGNTIIRLGNYTHLFYCGDDVRLTIEHIVFDGRKDVYDLERYCAFGLINVTDRATLMVNNCVFKDWHGKGICLSLKQSVIRDSQFLDNNQDGIYLRVDSQDVVIRDCYFSGNSRYGIGIDPLNGCVIEGNIFTNTGTAIAGEGIAGGPLTNVQVKNNCIYNTTRGAIRFNKNCKYFEVTGNICYGNTDGIRFVAYDPTLPNEHLIISKNQCYNNNQYGILIRDQASHIIISENEVWNNGQGEAHTFAGIMLYGNGDQIRHVQVLNNKVYDTQGTHTQAYGIRTYQDVDYYYIRGNECFGNADYQILDQGWGKNKKLYEQHSEFFMDVLAESSNQVVANEDISGFSGGETCTLDGQPDVPRNVTITVTDADTSISGFAVIVKGTDAKGNSIEESFEFSGGLSQTGNKAFATVSEVGVDSIAGNGTGDTLDVGIGSKLGLSNVIYAPGDVYKVKKNNADYASGNYTVDATYDTVDVSTGGTISGGDDFTIWYKSNLNVVS